MKFDTPATTNPIDQLKVIGKPTDRIDGPLKTTGTAPYAYERHDVVANQAYGFIVGSAIAKGRMNYAYLFGGAEIQHYHQAVAIVVAETFEQARAAAYLIRVNYSRETGKFDLAAEAENAPLAG